MVLFLPSIAAEDTAESPTLLRLRGLLLMYMEKLRPGEWQSKVPPGKSGQI